MGLYLCIFDDDNELEGVEVGTYSDFAFVRETISRLLEDDDAGSKYPALILHSDSDGEWSPAECATLKRELEDISDRFRELPPIVFPSEWQRQVAKSQGLQPISLYDCFIDVDGEPLLERLIRLCDLSIEKSLPILFQ